MKLKNILLTGALTLALATTAANAETGLGRKLSPNYPTSNTPWSLTGFDLNSGDRCDVSFYNNGNLRQAAHEGMFNYIASENPALIDEKCSSGITGNCNFSQGDLLDLMKTIYGTTVRRTFEKVVNSAEEIDFGKYDGLLRTFVNNPTLQPEVLIADYKVASSTIKKNVPTIQKFMKDAKQNPMVRPLWETSDIGTKSNTVDIQFVLRRLMDLGYTSENFLVGLNKLDKLAKGYEGYLVDKNSF